MTTAGVRDGHETGQGPSPVGVHLRERYGRPVPGPATSFVRPRLPSSRAGAEVCR
ncbi:hypothetical protein SAMN05660690_2225 [Geodermatophilus telluris]|uniref:Uncharacterized protein n=1 Tax=Geodermatophilus telluris TaxID=1190417 RepID=A0A1G6NTH0_9ACTN|nr:hypothetical protein SAMN05660690_2225 [Geodermatophilus telluris]